MRFVEEKTAGRLLLGAGTLYGALNSLAEKGWIAPCSTQSNRKKKFLITPQGKAVVQKELSRLQKLVVLAEEITEDAQNPPERKERAE